jgi:hypothetical protein
VGTSLWKRRRPVGPPPNSEAFNQIQLASGGLRMELLDTATLYGVMRDPSGRQLSAWLEWLTYRRRVEVWLGGAPSDEQMRSRIAEAGEADEPAFLDLQRQASEKDWRNRSEGLAEAARTLEELGGEPLNEIVGHHSYYGLALLDAVHASLVLLDAGTSDERLLRADSEEILDLLTAARTEGVWEFMQPDKDQARPEPTQILRDRDPLSPDAAAELVQLLASTRDDGYALYARLALDGRELTAEELAAAREHLGTGAALLRRFGRSRTRVEESAAAIEPHVDLRVILVETRIIQRNLVLATSRSPAVRERAAFSRS